MGTKIIFSEERKRKKVPKLEGAIKVGYTQDFENKEILQIPLFI